MMTAIAFTTACVGTFILGWVFLRGAKVPEQHPVWGEPLMPLRRAAWEQWMATEIDARAHRQQVTGPEFRDRR
jgi:hypothetical protein